MKAEDIASIFLYIVACSGIYFNVFIAVSSYRTWLSDGSPPPHGLLLFCIGLSCAIFEAYWFSLDMSSYFWTEVFSSPNVCTVFINCLFASCIFFNMCQISLLCGFYCIKLVSSQHRIIQVLRSRLPSILPWVISGVLVISGVVLILLLSLTYTSVPVDADNITFCRRINDTYKVQIGVINYLFNFIIALPFCLILVSLTCTTFSLVQHVRRTSLDRSHLEAHINAAKTMILLLVLNTSFYVSNMIMNGTVLPLPWYWICVVIYFLFWPLQALTLILRTKKLYKSFIWRLHRRSSEKM